jgi:hypothetical protein
VAAPEPEDDGSWHVTTAANRSSSTSDGFRTEGSVHLEPGLELAVVSLALACEKEKKE